MRDARTAALGATAVFLSLVALASSNTWRSRCGWVTINPETTICCSGLVYVKGGINPACCGNVAYDSHYSICCNGRVHRKSGMLSRCCDKRGYDALSFVCLSGSVVPRRSLVSTTCCHTETGWKCCSKGKPCPCNLGGSGNVEVPGFRPACCDIISRFSKAQCCSAIVQRTGLMPTCCNSDRVRPVCCRSSTRSYRCCAKSYGVPACCTNAVYSEDDISDNGPRYQPAHYPTTSLPSYLIPVRPTPLPTGGSCCHSRSPQVSCCRALKPLPARVHNNNYVTKPRRTCCAYRLSCCAITEYNRHAICCQKSAPGRRPLCCKAPTPKPPEHRCYACKLNGNYHSKTAPLLIDSNAAESAPSQSMSNIKITKGTSAKLSCCRSINLRECCIDGVRLSGTYVECCTQEILSSARVDSQPGFRQDQGFPVGHSQSLPSDLALCASQPYRVSNSICCHGIVRNKYGSHPACCGSLSYDMDRQKCCGGVVRRTCTRRYTVYKYWVNGS